MSTVFAVIATYNGSAHVEKCINSLRGSDKSVSVIAVDNASSDGTLDIVQQQLPGATLFRLKRNLGFGRANNIGIKYAYDEGADHVLLINQDASISPDVAGGLAGLQNASPVYGVLSPLQLDGTGRKLDSLFAQHLSGPDAAGDLLGDALLRHSTADIYPVAFVNAAIWMVSRRCIEEVGLFNPAFRHYGEDVDYSARVAFFGLSTGIAPRFHGRHYRTQHTGVESRDVLTHLMREKAIITTRLARKTPGTFFNIASAFSRALLSSCPGNSDIATTVGIRTRLAAAVLSSVPATLRCKKIAYRGNRCFFENADSDRDLYACADP